MAEKTYTCTVTKRTPRVRSARLRSIGAGGGAVITGGGSAGGASSGETVIIGGDYLPLTGGTVSGRTTFEDAVSIEGLATLSGEAVISTREKVDYADIAGFLAVYSDGGVCHVTLDWLIGYIRDNLYYLNALVDSVIFHRNAGTGGESYALADLVATNGSFASYECDYSGVYVEDMLVKCADNPDQEEKSFTLTLRYTFADGSSKYIAIPGVQYYTDDPTPGPVISYSFTINVINYMGSDVVITVNGVEYNAASVTVFVEGDATVEWSATDGYSYRWGHQVVTEDTVIEVNFGIVPVNEGND